MMDDIVIWIKVMLLFFMVMIPTTYLFVNSGTITIERPYLNEYQSCKLQIKELQKSVQCPEVKCREGITGILWSIIGFFVMVGGFLYFWHNDNQLNKRKQELDLRETQINAQKSTKPSKRKGA